MSSPHVRDDLLADSKFQQTDNIESNVISVANDTQGASEELTSAHDYQRKAGRRALCLLLIFIVVLAIVLIAVSLCLLRLEFPATTER